MHGHTQGGRWECVGSDLDGGGGNDMGYRQEDKSRQKKRIKRGRESAEPDLDKRHGNSQRYTSIELIIISTSMTGWTHIHKHILPSLFLFLSVFSLLLSVRVRQKQLLSGRHK